MAKRKLAQAARPAARKTALDLAEEHVEASETSPRGAAGTPPPPQPRRGSGGGSATASPISRSTDRLSISLTHEERQALVDRAADFMRQGHRDLKTSRLVRVAIRMLLSASDDDILRVADSVPNLEKLRAR